MKKSFNRTGLIFLIFALLIGLSAAGLSVYIYLHNTDYTEITATHQSPLFKNNGLTYFYYGVFVAAIMAFSVFGFFCRKNAAVENRDNNVVTAYSALSVFTRCFAGVALLSTVYMQFNSKVNIGDSPYSLSGEAGMYQKCALVLAVAGALYFLLPAIISRPLPQTLSVLPGLTLVLWLCMQLLVTHYYMNDFITSPLRIFKLIGISFFIFFFLTDLRSMNPEKRKTGLFIAMGLSCFFISMVEALPPFLLAVCSYGKFSLGIETLYQFARITFGIYALTAVAPTLLSTSKVTASSGDAPLFTEDSSENTEEPRIAEITGTLTEQEQAPDEETAGMTDEAEAITEETSEEATEEAAAEAPEQTGQTDQQENGEEEWQTKE